MEDWRGRRAKIKHLVKSVAFQGFALSGLFHPKTKSECQTRPCETVPFFGHRVGKKEEMGLQAETRLAFHQPPPKYEKISDLHYFENGMAWNKGSLIERFSVQPIRISDLMRRPSNTFSEISSCAVVECDYVYSYGDWVHCYLSTILSTKPVDIPVLIPRHLAEKDYVRRDLKQANINWTAAEEWTKIRNALVLRKQNPVFYSSEQEVTAFRTAFSISPPPPSPGSVSYLGRFDLKGETVKRAFPSDAAAQYVDSIGGQVVRQSDLNTQSAPRYARDAETVIGDHGSGLLNILFWQPKTVIELVVNDWWVNNTLFIAAGMGVKNFGVIRVDGLTSNEIGEKIRMCQEFFGTKS